MSEKKIHGNSKYKPEYCEKIIEMGRTGMSKEQISGALNVGWDCLDNWAKKHEEFYQALRTAKNLELSYWESLGLQNVLETPGGQRLNGAVYNKIMAARFPSKYSERNKVELSGDGGGAIQIEHSNSIGEEILAELLASIQGSKSDDE